VCRDAGDHAFGADVFIDVRPMNAVPSPINCQFWRRADVASDKRHDHASGTLITRPSTNRAVIASSVT
jgi:hypothetical protein